MVSKLELTLRHKNVQRLFSTELNRTSGADVHLNLLYDYSSFLIAMSILRLGILRREHVRRLGYRLAVYWNRPYGLPPCSGREHLVVSGESLSGWFSKESSRLGPNLRFRDLYNLGLDLVEKPPHYVESPVWVFCQSELLATLTVCPVSGGPVPSGYILFGGRPRLW